MRPGALNRRDNIGDHMGRLVLTRKINQTVKVGSHFITVTRVGRANANLMTATPRKVHSCNLGDMVILEAGVSVTLKAISCGVVRLLFEAPPEVKIARLELIDEYSS